jgi:hypothetical protein
MADPPSLEGAAQETRAEAFPAVATTLVGRVGTLPDVTNADGAEAGLVPALLDAVTVNLCGVPLVSPVTSRLVAAGPVVRRAPI